MPRTYSDKYRVPCQRCGVPVFTNPRAKVTGICKDCRAADPTYIRAIRTGVSLR